MRFVICPLHLSKVLCLPWKSGQVKRSAAPVRQITLANLKIWCSKMQPLSGNQRSDLLTSLMNMSFVLRLPREMHLCRSSSNAPRPPSFLKMLQNPHVLLRFDKMQNPLRLPHKTTLQRAKVARTFSVFDIILASKCASQHNAVHFRHLNLMVCLHFDFEMCFAHPCRYRGGGRGGQNQPVEFHCFLLGNPGVVIQPFKWSFEVTFLKKPWALVRKYVGLAPELKASMTTAAQFLEGCHPYTCAASVWHVLSSSGAKRKYLIFICLTMIWNDEECWSLSKNANMEF